MFIKPSRPGLIIRDPMTYVPLPAEGCEVDSNLSYWRRRIKDGDAVEVKAAQPAAVQPAPASEKHKRGEK